MSTSNRNGPRDSASHGGASHGSTSHRAVSSVAELPTLRDLTTRAERIVGRGTVVGCFVLLVTLFVVWVWPILSLQFSAVRPVVDTLYSSSVYVGDGVQGVDESKMEGIIGKRPLAVVVLATGDPLADSAKDTCSEIVDHVEDVIVEVIVDGKFAYGCEGDDIGLAAGTEWFGWDFVFWMQHQYATSLADGEINEMTRALALEYDAEVAGGRLTAATRTFSAPPQRMGTAAAIAGGVVGGIVVLFFVLRLVTRRVFAAADRRRAWDYRREQIDGEISNVAMRLMSVDPSDRARPRAAAAATQVAADYRWVLDTLGQLTWGSDLEPVAHRVSSISTTLDRAGVPG